MTDIATFTNEQLIAVCRADVAEMSKFLKEGEFSNPSRAAMYLRITEIALAALMGEFSFARNRYAASTPSGHSPPSGMSAQSAH